VTSALTLTPTPRVPVRFLADDDRDLLGYLLGVIGRKKRKNQALADYYDSRMLVKSLAMAVPPEFDRLETVCGWPGTVLDVLNERRTIDHIVVPDSAEMTDLINAAWDANDLDSEAPQAQLSEGMHGISFVVVARDDDRTIVLPTPATRMTAEYDRSKRRFTAAASNDDALRPGDPRQATLYLPDRTLVVELVGGRYSVIGEFENPSGVVPVERFVNRQRLDAPWGRSEITPAVISATDRAVRTLVAMEVGREAYAMPKEILFNVAQEAFQNADGSAAQVWDMYWTRFKALTGEIGEDGEPSPLQPDVKQLPASSPSTLIEMIKMDSQLVAAEAGIPPSMLGFVTDNPPSGDGMRMYENRLVQRANMRNRIDGAAWARTCQLMLLAEGVPAESLPRVKVIWQNPATFAPAAITDAVTKQVTAGVVPADSDVALEELGYDRVTVERIQQDRRKARAAGVVDRLAAAAGPQTEPGGVSADSGANTPVPAG
jgi:hypothetical protein